MGRHPRKHGLYSRSLPRRRWPALTREEASVKADAGIQFWPYMALVGFSSLIKDVFPVRPERITALLPGFFRHNIRKGRHVDPAGDSRRGDFGNALLVSVADSMEVEQHEYITMTMDFGLCIIAAALGLPGGPPT